MIENVDYEISKKVFAIFGFPARILEFLVKIQFQPEI